MGSIKVGSTAIKGVCVGSTSIKKVYVGSTLIWSITYLTGAPNPTNSKKGLVKVTSSVLDKSDWKTALILPDGKYAVSYGDGTSGDSVKVLTSAGAVSFTYGSTGTGNGQFRAPCGMCWVPETGELFVSEYNSNSTPTYITKLKYTGYSFEFQKKLSIPSVVIGPLHYCKARNAILVPGWGPSSQLYQVPLTLASYSTITNTGFPTWAGQCAVTASSDGKKIYVGQYSGGIYEATFSAATATAASSHRTIVSNVSGPVIWGLAMLSGNTTLLVCAQHDGSQQTGKEYYKLTISSGAKTSISTSMVPTFGLYDNGNNVFTGTSREGSNYNQIHVYRYDYS